MTKPTVFESLSEESQIKLDLEEVERKPRYVSLLKYENLEALLVSLCRDRDIAQISSVGYHIGKVQIVTVNMTMWDLDQLLIRGSIRRVGRLYSSVTDTLNLQPDEVFKIQVTALSESDIKDLGKYEACLHLDTIVYPPEVQKLVRSSLRPVYKISHIIGTPND